MGQSRRPRLWFALALVVALVIAAALWLRGALLPGTSQSPLPTPLASEGSTARTPPTAPSPLMSAGTALLWVALGFLLALGIVFIVARRHRHTAR